MIDGYHQISLMGFEDMEGLSEDGRLIAAVMAAEAGPEAADLIRRFVCNSDTVLSGRDLLDSAHLIFCDERMRDKAMKAELYI